MVTRPWSSLRCPPLRPNARLPTCHDSTATSASGAPVAASSTVVLMNPPASASKLTDVVCPEVTSTPFCEGGGKYCAGRSRTSTLYVPGGRSFITAVPERPLVEVGILGELHQVVAGGQPVDLVVTALVGAGEAAIDGVEVRRVDDHLHVRHALARRDEMPGDAARRLVGLRRRRRPAHQRRDERGHQD